MAKDAGKKSKNAKVVKDPAMSAASKSYVRVIVSERNEKTGSYVFKEKIIHKDLVKDFLATQGK
ncbi:MAG: DUF4295 domain-containing protein [Chitinophagales bacterium]|nr:DUF4295 domain-containing protein [Chitinophagales bacterium]MDW8428868.1 DUF4295 family protein [Chitinophagales bacterium]